jgi:hypothetical protein
MKLKDIQVGERYEIDPDALKQVMWDVNNLYKDGRASTSDLPFFEVVGVGIERPGYVRKDGVRFVISQEQEATGIRLKSDSDPHHFIIHSNPIRHSLTEVRERQAAAKAEAEQRQRAEEQALALRVEMVPPYLVGHMVEMVERDASGAADDLKKALEDLADRVNKALDTLTNETVKVDSDNLYDGYLKGTGYQYLDLAPVNNSEGLRLYPSLATSSFRNGFNGSAEKATEALGRYEALREQHNRWQRLMADDGSDEPA